MGSFGIVFCPLLLAALVYAPQVRLDDGGQSSLAARNFVQEFYDWYVPIVLHDNSGPASDVALMQKQAVFGRKLFRALKSDSEAQAKAQGYIVGIDFDPFLASQDPCERYEVGKVSRKGSSYEVPIYGVCSGQRSARPDVVAEISREDGYWIFTNFMYPEIHSDLLSTLKTLRKERQRQKRKSSP